MPYFSKVKAPLAAFGLFLLTCTAHAAPTLPAPDDPRALTAWFSDLGPRREGSKAEAQVFAALRSWFKAAEFQESSFSEMEGEHSFSRRLWFRVIGKAPGELIVVAPTDGVNHRGLAWAVAWANDALVHGTEISLTFLFTGAERGTGSSASLGSRAFLQDFYPTVPAAAVYLDAADTDQEILVTAESGLFPSPLWMVRGLTEALDQQKLRPRFTGTAPSLFRLDLPERKNALAVWFERGIPAVLVAGGPRSLKVVRSLEGFVTSIKDGMPNYWDRHYLVFDLGFVRFFWSQTDYLLIFLTLVAVLLFGYALLGRGQRGSLRVLGQRFWQLPVLFAFLFLTLYAATSLTTLLQEARGMPDFWKTSPLLVWTFKVFVAISLYLVLFLPLRRSPLSRNPDFYGQAALAWLGIMVLVAAGFELTFSFYFLWALVWCAVLVVVPWPPLRFLSMLAAPLWLVKAAWDVLGPQPDLALSQWALDSPIAGNFALAVLFFPFLLQLTSWHFSGEVHQRRNEGLRAAAQLTLTGLTSLFLALAVLQANPPSNSPDQARALKVNLEETPRENLWKTRASRSAFLDRTVWSLRFSGATDPERVEFNLESDTPLTIFDCSFPVVVSADGSSARIIVGRQPTLPLDLRITLPASTRAHLRVKVLFTGAPGLEASDTVELRP